MNLQVANKNPIQPNFKDSDESLNSRKPKIICSSRRRCKRMICDTCRGIRREYFIKKGALFALTHSMDTHLILSWKNNKHFCKWISLTSNMAALSKRMSGKKVKPYIRVISIGGNGCPHVHFFCSTITAEAIKSIANKIWGRKVKAKTVYLLNKEFDAPNILGYFFDQNFIPSFLNKSRVKGIRLIAATRPMPCGFPMKAKNLPQLHIEKESSLTNWNGKKGLMENETSPT